MRNIKAEKIIDVVADMCIEANNYISNDVKSALENAEKTEKSPIGQQMLGVILDNAKIAKECNMPICQDTGMAVFYVKVGNDVHIEGMNLTDAINEGARKGYTEGYLRKSVVSDPLRRKNTNDNTPAVIHYEMVDGDKLAITFAPKGFGSENMSALKMLKPAQGKEGVIDFVLQTVDAAGSNPCPPMVVGVGIGGTIDKCAQLAKKALMREVGKPNGDPFYAEFEKILLEKINKLGTGPQGLGGSTTAIGVNIETFPTHIAGLPVCVNINCHATRHLTKTI